MVQTHAPSPASITLRLARLLVRLEEDAFADAKPCPFCHAGEDELERLPHTVDCELDRALSDAGLR